MTESHDRRVHQARLPRVVVTGAAGFIGWHTRVRLRALGGFEVVPIWPRLWPACLAKRIPISR